VKKPREIAVQILRRHSEQTGYLENLLEDALARSSVSPVDRGLVQELTFGVVRWQATLDWLIAQKTAGRTQKAALQILLRLGLYQIFWLERIPDHAAVHETVEMAKHLGFGAQSGFINAILRAYLREQAETEKKLQELKLRQPALGYSHPDWLVDRWQQRWGDEPLRKLLEHNNTPPPLYARLNTLKTTAEKLAAQWEKEGVLFTPREWNWTGKDIVFELRSHPPLATLPSFQQGSFYIQDPSTLLAVHELSPQPGESILDLCAAPGGKTTYIAQQLQNNGRILAQDVSPARLDLGRENCARLGVSCVEMALLSGTPQEAADPTNRLTPHPSPLPVEGRGGTTAASAREFDRVLLDVPCSNTGVMRRRVDLRWRIRPEEIDRLRQAQVGLLEGAALELKHGGTLVYSTCSLEPEENEQVIQEFLARHADFRLANQRALLPFVEGTDGAYVARLAKAAK